MTALTQPQSDALSITLRNSTQLGRLSLGELNTVFTTLSSLGYTIQMTGSTGGSYITSEAEFAKLATLLCDKTGMSRLSLVEALAAILKLQALGYPVLRPSSLGVS
jgi:hypothetical protein